MMSVRSRSQSKGMTWKDRGREGQIRTGEFREGQGRTHKQGNTQKGKEINSHIVNRRTQKDMEGHEDKETHRRTHNHAEWLTERRTWKDMGGHKKENTIGHRKHMNHTERQGNTQLYCKEKDTTRHFGTLCETIATF